MTNYNFHLKANNDEKNVKTKRTAIWITFLVLLTSSSPLLAQESGNLKLTFSALHIVEDDLPEYTDQYMDMLHIGQFPSTVHHYDLQQRFFKVPSSDSLSPEKYLIKVIQEKKLANEVVENNVFHVKDGIFNMEPIYEQVKEEAADVFALIAHGQGRRPDTDEERAYFNRVINTRYLIVFHHHGLQKINGTLNEGKGPRGKGFVVNQDVYIFQIDLGDETIHLDFWENGYTDGASTPEAIAKAATFRKNMVYPLIKHDITESKNANTKLKKALWYNENDGVKAKLLAFKNPTEEYIEEAYFELLGHTLISVKAKYAPKDTLKSVANKVVKLTPAPSISSVEKVCDQFWWRPAL